MFPKAGKPASRHTGPRQTEHPEVGHGLEMNQTSIGHAGVGEPELLNASVLGNDRQIRITQRPTGEVGLDHVPSSIRNQLPSQTDQRSVVGMISSTRGRTAAGPNGKEEKQKAQPSHAGTLHNRVWGGKIRPADRIDGNL